MTQSSDLRAAAQAFTARGWATHPLRLNSDGFAKVAIVEGWERLTPSDAVNLDWSQAAGIGVIGGANSGNLAFIDVDEEDLAWEVLDWTCRHHPTLMAWTARGRIHVYLYEHTPSLTRKLRVEWKGKEALVELRASGAYVAAPPTPNYSWATEERVRHAAMSIAWAEIAASLDIKPIQQASGLPGNSGGAGYPSGWAGRIGNGERNDACFYESSCLKDGHIPMDTAWAFMQARINQSYDPPIDWRELRRTFESAYKRPPSEQRIAVDAVGGESFLGSRWQNPVG